MFADRDAMERRSAAEAALLALDARAYRGVATWLDYEIYDHLYGENGSGRAHVDHVPALLELLRARRAVYAALRHGVSDPERLPESSSESINEFLVQTLDAALQRLGDGRLLPTYRDWHEFFPTSWSPLA